MNIRLIDVDGHNFPNLPLMKLSAWHKQQGDTVAWYDPLSDWQQDIDRVYMSKIFTFTQDYPHPVSAKEIIRGGTGYYYPDGGNSLPDEIEHTYPDYGLYPDLTKNTAYGFLTRGCPRGCDFCIVGKKEGRCSVKVADLSEFWNGQKNIVLLDPNITACPEWKDLFQQLINSGARVDFSQGLDIRMMTDEKAEMLMQMKIKQVHFAWDRYEEKDIVVPRLKAFAERTGWRKQKMGVFVLTNFNTSFEQDLERVYIIRDLGYSPYVMIYDKQNVKRGHDLRRLQRWVNSRVAFSAVEKFENFK